MDTGDLPAEPLHLPPLPLLDIDVLVTLALALPRRGDAFQSHSQLLLHKLHLLLLILGSSSRCSWLIFARVSNRIARARRGTGRVTCERALRRYQELLVRDRSVGRSRTSSSSLRGTSSSLQRRWREVVWIDCLRAFALF